MQLAHTSQKCQPTTRRAPKNGAQAAWDPASAGCWCTSRQAQEGELGREPARACLQPASCLHFCGPAPACRAELLWCLPAAAWPRRCLAELAPEVGPMLCCCCFVCVSHAGSMGLGRTRGRLDRARPRPHPCLPWPRSARLYRTNSGRSGSLPGLHARGADPHVSAMIPCNQHRVISTVPQKCNEGCVACHSPAATRCLAYIP